MKRTGLFLLTNLAILLVLSLVVRLLGLERHLSEAGLNLDPLLAFAAVFGMGGALVSLAMSTWSAKRMVGARVIEQPATAVERSCWIRSTGRSR